MEFKVSMASKVLMDLMALIPIFKELTASTEFRVSMAFKVLTVSMV